MNILLILYNLILLPLYLPVALVVYLFIKDKRLHWQRFGFNLPKGKLTSSIWIHAASVGEVRGIVPLVEDLRNKYRGISIIISTGTANGANTAIQLIKPDVCFLLPIENRWAYSKILRQYKPLLMIIVETEIWPNLIDKISQRIPMILLNGRISDKSFKSYNRFSFIFKQFLGSFRYIIAKSKVDADRFALIIGDSKNIVVGSNIKYRYADLPVGVDFSEIFGKYALIASTHNPEETIFIDKYSDIKGYDRLVIAPRHVERGADIVRYAISRGYTAGFYSDGDFSCQIIVMDKMGLMNDLYANADKIFVGGSIAPIGGHNVFEPFLQHKTVAVGEYMGNFADIVPLAQKYKLLSYIDSGDIVSYFNDNTVHNPDFEGFFKEIEAERLKYDKILKRCIDECIGY